MPRFYRCPDALRAGHSFGDQRVGDRPRSHRGSARLRLVGPTLTRTGGLALGFGAAARLARACAAPFQGLLSDMALTYLSHARRVRS